LACHFAELKRSAYQQLDNFLRQPENLLFRYWEYLGSDFSADMHLLAEFEITLQWWSLSATFEFYQRGSLVVAYAKSICVHLSTLYNNFVR